MDEQKRPRSREKKVVNEGKGVEKHGEGLGTGPVNNTGNYQDRRDQQQSAQRPQQSQSHFGSQRPQSGSGFPFGQSGQQSSQQNSFGSQRPQSGSGFPFGQNSQQSRQRPYTSSQRPSSGTQPPSSKRASKSGRSRTNIDLVFMVVPP